ncbi:peptidoglycan-binding domain-containing protein [Amycolatopsis benzoatilytica]|uniref:peptidoglycan-binding domain-containing protein n=1 Tax=Amycolatopsis benzoatilytica TaxID=346045 RepID=UPI000367BD6C|nr:peptidoglycan-binding domain-containing protein [Amycolatopsis benzoatilytica]
MTGKTNRARWFLAAGATVVVLGTSSAVVLTHVASGGETTAAAKPVATAEIANSDLKEEENATGKLGYGKESVLAGKKSGTITSLPAQGAVLSRGKSAYTVDAKPVPLFYGTLPFYRPLNKDADKGPDVKQLEENLRALGYGGFGTPDEKFTAATETALKRWQKSLGVDQTGAFDPADVVLAPGEIRVSAVTGQLGAPGAGELFKYTGTARIVTAELDAAKQSVAQKDAKVSVSLNGTTLTGTVTDVGTTAAADKEGQGDGKAKVAVQIKMDDPAAAGDVIDVPVSVQFTKAVHKDVLVVPVGALVTLAEGGYAVEVDDQGKRRLVGVETGLFSGGMVEIKAAGLRAGQRVVTTS